jgi:hypothetical protein
VFVVIAQVGSQNLPVSAHESEGAAWDTADKICEQYNLTPLFLGMPTPYEGVIKGKRVIIDVYECKSIEDLVK